MGGGTPADIDIRVNLVFCQLVSNKKVPQKIQSSHDPVEKVSEQTRLLCIQHLVSVPDPDHSKK